MTKAFPIDATEKMNWKVVLVASLLMIPLIAMMWGNPRGNFVLVVAKPFSSAQSTWSLIASANGSFVSGGIVPWVAVAYSSSPSFPARLRSAGALLVLNAGFIATCQQEASHERPR